MRSFILICFLVFAFASSVRAEESAKEFPLSCTRAAAPLKNCLIEEIIGHVKIGPTNDNDSRRALTTIADVVADQGTPEQVARMVDILINELKGRTVKNEDDLWLVNGVLEIVGMYGTETQIRQALDINAAMPHKLTSISEEELAKYSFNLRMDGIKRLNELYLKLALGNDNKVETALAELAKKEKFNPAPDQNLQAMGRMLLHRGPLQRALNFMQNTNGLKFEDVSHVLGGSFMHFPPSLLSRLALSFLENGDVASAKIALELCDKGDMFRYGSDCRDRLEYAEKMAERISCTAQEKILNDPSFLKGMAENWQRRTGKSSKDRSKESELGGPAEPSWATQALGASPDCDSAVSKLAQASVSSAIAGEDTAEFVEFLKQVYGRARFMLHSDEQQKKELEAFWGYYLAQAEKSDNAWLEMQVKWNKESTTFSAEAKRKSLEDVYAQDKAQKASMAGLKYSYRISNLFTLPVSGGEVEYVELKQKYPKAFASLDKILP
ncbi:MAG: hypothetical protein ACAH83_00920 [Alphaproteobacteria bacterium]